MLRYVLGIPSALTATYYLYKSDGDPFKAWGMFENTCTELRYGPPIIPRNKKNSKFESFFSPETKALIGGYFLQLDLDKENGVTRNDVIEFLNKAGFSESDFKDEFGSFIARGRGGTPQRKRVSGCSLQEAVEFMEKIVQASEKKSNPSDDSGKPAEKTEPVLSSPTEAELKIQSALHAISPPSGWSENLIPLSIWSSPVMDLKIGKLQTEQEIQEEKLSELKSELASLTELMDGLLDKKEKKGSLTIVECRRLEGVERDILQLNEEIKLVEGKRWW
eukprot:GDKJ01011737.1.p1 GENE.GDKJ01011737.1~~GDKJ01011737.1.p1  ORF type:complete len:277 (+),score=71.02 GDKJ01011737.1:16-846(+)